MAPFRPLLYAAACALGAWATAGQACFAVIAYGEGDTVGTLVAGVIGVVATTGMLSNGAALLREVGE